MFAPIFTYSVGNDSFGGDAQYCFTNRRLRTMKALSIMDYFPAGLVNIIAEEVAIVGGVFSHHSPTDMATFLTAQ